MGVGALLSLSGIGREVGWGGLLFGGRLLTFSAFRMGAYSRWALIRGWALIRINTVDIIYYFGPNLKSQEKKNEQGHEQGQISASDYLLLHAAVTIAYLFSSGIFKGWVGMMLLCIKTGAASLW